MSIDNLEAEIATLRAKLAEAESSRDRLRQAAMDTEHKVQQILGAAIGYPRYCDSPETFPGATEADGVCVGDHVAETLAMEAAARIAALTAERDRYRTDTELLDWLADNDIMEGFAGVDDDVNDISFHVAMERGASEDDEPTADDKRQALRILIERAASMPESEATDGNK